MPHDAKIATCCYCGSRTVLRLTARHGHELACGSCGAPLHEMKSLKQVVDRAPAARARRSAYVPDRPARPIRKRRRKSVWKRAMAEVFDVIEDVFD